LTKYIIFEEGYNLYKNVPYGATTVNIIAFSVTTCSILGLIARLGINDIYHNDTQNNGTQCGIYYCFNECRGASLTVLHPISQMLIYVEKFARDKRSSLFSSSVDDVEKHLKR